MVVVKAPLFSLGASGTIGGALVYSTWKGRDYVRSHAVPANPKSVGQLSIRAMMKFLSQAWDALSDADQAVWENRAAVTNISPFNAFVAYNLTRWGLGDTPSKVDPAPEAGAPGTIANEAATAQSRAIEVETEATVLDNMYGICIYRDPQTGLTGLRNELVQVVRAEALAVYAWLDFPLTPGTAQFYVFRAFSMDGVLGPVSGEVTATPTV